MARFRLSFTLFKPPRRRSRCGTLLAALVCATTVAAGCSSTSKKATPTTTMSTATITSAPTSRSETTSPNTTSATTSSLTANPSPITIRSTDPASTDLFEVVPSPLPTNPKFPSVISGPFEVHTSTGTQPAKPVKLTFAYDPARVTDPGALRVLHYSTTAQEWLFETTTIDTQNHTATALLGSLSGVDLAEVVGVLTGNRAGRGPTGCAGTIPDWVDGVIASNNTDDALRSCLTPSGDEIIVLHLLNNRGSPMTIDTSAGSPSITQDVDLPSSVAAMLAATFARLGANEHRLVLLPGEEAALTYERPATGSLTVTVNATYDLLGWVVGMLFQSLEMTVAASDATIPETVPTADFADLGVGTDCGLALSAVVTGASATTGASAITSCLPDVVKALKGRLPDSFVTKFNEFVLAYKVVENAQLFLDSYADKVLPPKAEFTMVSAGVARPQQVMTPSPGLHIPTSAWRLVGQTVWTPVGNTGGFSVQSSQQYWGGVRALTKACDYKFSAQARVLSGKGYGLNVRETFGPGDVAQEGHGFQYDPGAEGLRDIEYPDVEASPTALLLTDNGWHTVVVEVQDGRYRTTLDGALVFTGTTAATCGQLYIRVWSGAAEFRNVALEPTNLRGSPLDGPPTITSVSTITRDNFQDIAIRGTNFGRYAPTDLALPCISIYDRTTNPPWEAGHADVANKGAQSFGACSAARSSAVDLVTLRITKWTDTEITIGGFGGSYGDLAQGWVLHDGDTIRIRVANAQTGVGPAEYITAVERFGSPNPQVFSDGGFEQPAIDGNYMQREVGFNVGGWTVTAGNVDQVRDFWRAAEGTQSVDLSGLVPGRIEQTFTTEVGRTYKVRFAIAGNPNGEPNVKTLRLTVGGASEDLQFDDTGRSFLAMGWDYREAQFTAGAGSTIISFESLTASRHGPALDDVSVTPSS